MSVSDDSFQAPPAAPANRSSIASSQAMNRAPQIPSKISLSRGSSSKLSRKDADKVGRWSDEEHQVFLVGLEKHGKQWKTIATMIGTRTVVQVRTHAQKYFQKLERKTKSSSSSVGSEDSFTAAIPTSKRKSLPLVMSSDQYRATKLIKTEESDPNPASDKPRISISLSNIPSCTNMRNIPTPTADIISGTSAFSCSSSSENLSTVSPAGVNELDLGLWGSGAESNFYMEGSDYQDCVVEDPLEWFNLDAPDVPIFPDFQETMELPLHSKDEMAVDSFPCMDPKVTVQSLFLDEQPLHM